MKRRRRLCVTTRLFSLFVRDPRTVDFREHTFMAGSIWAEPPNNIHQMDDINGTWYLVGLLTPNNDCVMTCIGVVCDVG